MSFYFFGVSFGYSTGPTGATGPQGLPGITGATGATGAQGPPGPGGGFSLSNLVDGLTPGSVRGIGTATGIGVYAFAEGWNTSASAASAHAEGTGTTASGEASHAEGWGTIASSLSAHAEGLGTIASGDYSHAGGLSTIALGGAQTAIGRYNVADPDALFIVGDGTDSDNRHNALVVSSTGMVTIPGLTGAAGLIGPTGPTGATGPAGGSVQTNYAYALQEEQITVIDASTLEVVNTISLPGLLGNFLAANPNNSELYVASESFLSIIDSEIGNIKDTISIADSALQLEFNPTSNKLYVRNQNFTEVVDGTTHVISGNTLQNLGSIAVDTVSGNAYAVNMLAAEILVIGGENADEIIDSISLPTNAVMLTIDASSRSLYAFGSDDMFYLINLNDYAVNASFYAPYFGLLFTIQANPAFNQVYTVSQQAIASEVRAYTPYGTELGVSPVSFSGLFKIDPSTSLIFNYSTSSAGIEVLSGSIDGYLQYIDSTLGNVSNVYDFAFMRSRNGVGPTGPTGPTGPMGECNCGCTGYAYAAVFATGTTGSIEVIDPATQQVVKTFPTNATNDVAVNPARGEIYAAGSEGVEILDINTGAVIDLFGTAAERLMFNPVNNKLYVYNFPSVSVYDIATRTQLSTMNSGVIANIAVDPVTNNVYLTGYSAISIINGNTNVIESNFPVGAFYNLVTEIDPARRRLYLGGSNNLGTTFELRSYQLDTQQLLESRALSYYVSSIAADPRRNLVYISANGATDVLNGDTLAVTGTMDGYPITLDQKNNILYGNLDGDILASDTITGQQLFNVPVSDSDQFMAMSVADCAMRNLPGVVGPAGPTGAGILRQPKNIRVANQTHSAMQIKLTWRCFLEY